MEVLTDSGSVRAIVAVAAATTRGSFAVRASPHSVRWGKGGWLLDVTAIHAALARLRGRSRWRAVRPAVVATLGSLVLGSPLACRPDPTRDIALAEMVVQMSDAVNQVQQDNALLQAQIDSLREVVARQDTLIRRLANVTGVPVPP